MICISNVPWPPDSMSYITQARKVQCCVQLYCKRAWVCAEGIHPYEKVLFKDKNVLLLNNLNYLIWNTFDTGLMCKHFQALALTTRLFIYVLRSTDSFFSPIYPIPGHGTSGIGSRPPKTLKRRIGRCRFNAKWIEQRLKSGLASKARPWS